MEALNANLFKFKIPSENESSSGSDYSDEEEFVNPLANLPTEVVHRVLALENLHEKRAEIEIQFKKELAVLEKKYEDMYAPLYADRARIINGEREVTEEEYAGREESGVALVEEKSSSDIKGIPEFWLNVLKRSQLAGLVFEADEAALKYLRDIKSDRVIDEEAPKLTVSFHFAPNEFFSNEVLSMTVIFNPQGNGVVGWESSPIAWKEGKNLCFKTVTRKMRHRSKPGVFTNKESQEEIDSFFHLFDEISGCDHDHEEGEEHDHDDQESKIMANAEICSFLDRYIIPGAIEWYMGRGDDGNGDDEDYEEYEDFDYEDEEDDE